MPATPEQHHVEKRRVEQAGGQHLVPGQQVGDVPGFFHEARAVGAEPETHRDARYDPEGKCEGKRERKDLDPEAVGAPDPDCCDGRKKSRPWIGPGAVSLAGLLADAEIGRAHV